MNIVSAVRKHWEDNANAYPQAIALDQVSMKELIDGRKVVRQGLGSSVIDPGPTMLGIKLVVGESNVLVAKDGTRVPLVN